MSFSTKTDKLVQDLIQAEFGNACDNFGGTYHSLHEGYAVLLEEVEEAESCVERLKSEMNFIWDCIKSNREEALKTAIDDCFNVFTNNSIKELAQVGAVLMKIQNTINKEKGERRMIEQELQRKKRVKKELNFYVKSLANKFIRRNHILEQYDGSVAKLIQKAYISAYNLCIHHYRYNTDLSRANRVVWHDLRKNPNDLPKNSNEYLTNIGVLYFNNSCNNRWYTPICEICDDSEEVKNEVIAWCELPKFEVEE